MFPAAAVLALSVASAAAPAGSSAAIGPVARKPLAPIARVRTRAPTVAITFDACATQTKGYGFDRALFEIVRREAVPVTIFVSGRWVESHPDVMKELAAEPLVELGDHSYSHPHMSRLQRSAAAAQLDRTEAALAVYGKKAVAFRPPFGDWNNRVLHLLRRRGLAPVLWDVVSGDVSAKVKPEQMIRTVLHKTRAGSIIVFHINGRGNGPASAEALPVIIRELRARGFRLVTVSELLGSGRPILATPTAAGILRRRPAGRQPDEAALRPPPGAAQEGTGVAQ